MDRSQSPERNDPINKFTLLAVTTLAFSNMLVGLMQNNTFLVLASAALSAAFAIFYSNKLGLVRLKSSANSSEQPESAKTGAPRRRFPLWMFLALIFILMPFVLLVLQRATI